MKPNLEQAFSLPFSEASAFFRGKINFPTDQWDDLWKDQHARGFMVAGAQKAELLADFRAAVQKAVDGEMTLPEFREQFDSIVSKHGWSYKGGRNWRSAIIYNTNVRTAYMAGRWAQLTEPGTLMPYLVYRHADGVLHPRPLHVAWDGLTLKPEDPFWRTHYPPNGWGCHCKAYAASKADYDAAVAQGKGAAPAPVADLRTGAPLGIDYGWDYNVGMAADRSYKVLGDKFEGLPNDIARRWMEEHVAGPAFARFVEGKVSGEFPVAVLNQADKAALGAETQTVWMSQQTLLEHLDKHPEIGLDDYRLIPEIIDQGEVYRQGDTRLIYLSRGDVLYRAALKRAEEGDRDNWFLSLFKTSDRLADIQVREKLERIR